MNNIGGKRFKFKHADTSSKDNGKVEDSGKIRMPKGPKFAGHYNYGGNSSINVGKMRPNPYHDRGKFESPSKKMRFAANNVRKTEIDEFDDDLMLDLDNDDFCKDLTVDELNLLEVEASQQVKPNKIPTNHMRNIKNLGNPYRSKTSLLLPEMSTGAKNYPEKTLDLFSTGKTVDQTFLKTDVKTENFDTDQLKQLQGELSMYVDNVKRLEEITFGKDGEIKILRQGLNKAEEDKEKLRIEIQKLEGNLSDKQTENEKRLQREVERLQTQLQFKDKEIQEVRESKIKRENSPKKVVEKMALKKTSKSSDFHAKGGNSSPRPSSGKQFSPVENALFHQNWFGSPKAVKRDQKKGSKENSVTPCEDSNSLPEQTMERPLVSNRFKQCRAFNYGFTLIEKELSYEIEVLHGTQIEYDSLSPPTSKGKEKMTIGLLQHQFVFKCIQELKGNDRRNIVTLLEMIEPHIEKLSKDSTTTSKSEFLDLICQEAGPSESNVIKTHHKESCVPNHMNNDIGIAALIVLMVIIKYDSSLQDEFLKVLNEQNSDKRKYGRLKKLSHFEDGLVDEDFSHIHVSKQTSSSAAKISNFFDINNGQERWLDSSKLNNCGKIVQHLFDMIISKKCQQSVTESVFEILASLSSCCSKVSKSGLVKQFAQHNIISLVAASKGEKRLSSMILVFKSLSSTDGFEEIICQCCRSCSLRTVYGALTKKPDDFHARDWEDFKLETVHTLSTMISCCPKALRVILEADCDCSSELIKSLVIMLFKEYKDIRQDYLLQMDSKKLMDSKNLLLLRQGISLLAHISLNDKKFMDHRVEVEWQYLDLIYGTIRLYRRIPSISENEVIAVQDLRDIDQYEDFEDSEEEPNRDFPMDH